MRHIPTYVFRIIYMPSPLIAIRLFVFSFTTLLNGYSSCIIVTEISGSLSRTYKSLNVISV
nr:MAG TPA: hypothetical protein [Crassvirales sp.]